MPIIEILFEYTSDIKLLELANLDQPLMRKLMIEAPGTYHHSVVVGTMVEAAAAEPGLILIDHANCELKAASTALGFLYRYPERTALAQKENSEALRGGRENPFAAGQHDKLAAALAADLKCQFGDRRLRFSLDEAVLQGDDRNLVALLDAYLADSGLSRVATAEDADVSVGLRRHRIEENLELLWVSARAAQPGGRRRIAEPVSASRRHR